MIRRNSFCVTFAISFLAFCTVGRGENPFLPPDTTDDGWPAVRGQHFDGHSAEIHLADEWPSAGPPILWSRKLGQGYSAVVVRGNRAYTQYQSFGGQYVVCLDADSGDTIWEYRYDWPYEPAGLYPGPRATPTLAGDAVYFGGPSGLVGCLDAKSGDLRWSLNVIEKFGGQGQGFGFSCSPTVTDDVVLLPVGGEKASLVALSAKDGSVLWTGGKDPASYTPAFPITLAGRELVIGYLQNSIVAHERETGELLWDSKLSSGYDEHSAWPLYREPYLWLSGPFRGGSTLHEITSTGLRPVWSNNKLSNDVCSSVLVGEHIYGFDVLEPQSKAHRPTRGMFRCLEFMTGKVSWSQGDEKKRPRAGIDVGHASVLCADGKLYLLNDMGELIMARVNPERYEELGRATVMPDEVVWTPPTLYRGRLYLRSHSQVMCVYVGNPDLLEKAAEQLAITPGTVSSISRRSWTEMLLPIEPEYAFDVPSREWLLSWFAAGSALLVCSVLATTLIGQWCKTSELKVLIISLALSAIAGAFGTTLLSHAFNDFVFTWPLSLFAVFYIALITLPISRKELTASQTWRTWAILALVLATCLLYYWL